MIDCSFNLISGLSVTDWANRSNLSSTWGILSRSKEWLFVSLSACWQNSSKYYKQAKGARRIPLQIEINCSISLFMWDTEIRCGCMNIACNWSHLSIQTLTPKATPTPSIDRIFKVLSYNKEIFCRMRFESAVDIEWHDQNIMRTGIYISLFPVVLPELISIIETRVQRAFFVWSVFYLQLERKRW